MNRIPEVIFYYSNYQLINGGCIMNKFLEMHVYHADPSSKKNIMKMESLSNKERLQAIFDIDKTTIGNWNIYLKIRCIANCYTPIFYMYSGIL